MVATMARLNGKVAAITGGASGIGEATVRTYPSTGRKCLYAVRNDCTGIEERNPTRQRR